VVEDKIPGFWKITKRELGGLVSLFVLYIIGGPRRGVGYSKFQVSPFCSRTGNKRIWKPPPGLLH
jgi:hypothetical protein